jgi:hypothetical protein
LRCGSRCKNGSPDLHKFAASRRIISSLTKFLKCHAAPCLQIVSVQLIDSHQVQNVLRKQLWLAGRCKTSTPRVSYANTHCECICVTDKEHSALLRCKYKFCVCPAANSYKSGEPILHWKRPNIKKTIWKILKLWRTLVWIKSMLLRDHLNNFFVRMSL